MLAAEHPEMDGRNGVVRLMIDLDFAYRLNLAFKRGIQDGLIEQGMVHSEEYAQVADDCSRFIVNIGDGSEYLWKYYRDGYDFGKYLLHVMSTPPVTIYRD